MKCRWVLVRWGGIGVWDDRQAGPCMGQCMGGAWVVHGMVWCMGGDDVMM